MVRREKVGGYFFFLALRPSSGDSIFIMTKSTLKRMKQMQEPF